VKIVSELNTAPIKDAPAARGRQAWLARLARFNDSGESPAAFCANERVSLPSFYSWRRRLAAETLQVATTQRNGHAQGPRLLPVVLHGSASAVEVVLPKGIVLRLSPDCDLAFVRSLVFSLGGASC
jgi:hypothetical protein